MEAEADEEEFTAEADRLLEEQRRKEQEGGKVPTVRTAGSERFTRSKRSSAVGLCSRPQLEARRGTCTSGERA